MTILGTSLIGAQRAEPSTATFFAINPATNQPLEPVFYAATAQDVDQAAHLAESAFAEFGRTSGAQRSRLLRRIATLIRENAETLAERAHLETGLPMARMQGELGRTTGQLDLFAKVAEEGHWVDARIDRAQPDRKPLPKSDLRSMLRPLGPIGVFSASNFPFAFSVAGGDTASALAAGCPVIVKAHPGHPGTSELTAQLIQQALADCNLPAGVFSLLLDNTYAVGQALVKHPLVKAIGFTGSTRGGRALMDAAAARPVPIPVFAEMGSVNPVFLLPKALALGADSLAAGLFASVTLGVGQFCTNPGVVFVADGPGRETFLAKLAELTKAAIPGVMLTPTLCTAYADGVNTRSALPGVQVLACATSTETESPAAVGIPQIGLVGLADFLACPELHEEIFGPYTLIVTCPSAAEFTCAARGLPGQLTATVHAVDGELAEFCDLLAAVESMAGRIVINGFPTGVEVCPAMHHGGPYPATSDGRSSSVGTRAIQRFARPVCYQDFPDTCLPEALQEANPLGLARMEA